MLMPLHIVACLKALPGIANIAYPVNHALCLSLLILIYGNATLASHVVPS